jgi:copper chaperone
MDTGVVGMATTQDTILSVPEISCEHCVKTIDGALGALPGVESVTTNLDSKTVSLRYDPAEVSMDTIEATLDEAGYTVAR